MKESEGAESVFLPALRDTPKDSRSQVLIMAQFPPNTDPISYRKNWAGKGDLLPL